MEVYVCITEHQAYSGRGEGIGCVCVCVCVCMCVCVVGGVSEEQAAMTGLSSVPTMNHLIT